MKKNLERIEMQKMELQNKKIKARCNPEMQKKKY